MLEFGSAKHVSRAVPVSKCWGSRDRKTPAAYWPEIQSAAGLNEKLCTLKISFAL